MRAQPPWREQLLPPLFLLLLSVMLGVLADGAAQERTLHEWTRSARRPLVAYLVMRAEDCEGHLELLRQLERPPIARTTERAGTVLIGPAAAVRSALTLLERELPDVPARRATLLDHRLLRRLGYGRTPVLLVLDARTGGIRFAARAPLTPGERLRFLAALTAVTSI